MYVCILHVHSHVEYYERPLLYDAKTFRQYCPMYESNKNNRVREREMNNKNINQFGNKTYTKTIILSKYVMCPRVCYASKIVSLCICDM